MTSSQLSNQGGSRGIDNPYRSRFRIPEYQGGDLPNLETEISQAISEAIANPELVAPKTAVPAIDPYPEFRAAQWFELVGALVATGVVAGVVFSLTWGVLELILGNPPADSTWLSRPSILVAGLLAVSVVVASIRLFIAPLIRFH